MIHDVTLGLPKNAPVTTSERIKRMRLIKEKIERILRNPDEVLIDVKTIPF